jgi:subtilisin family serine protease
VASLACASTNNGVGIAGAGRDCRLIVEKSDLTDASLAESIVDATRRGALAINMSLGDDGTRPPVQALVAAIDYAFSRNVVLVGAASNNSTQEQGQPPSLLQPTGTGPDLNAGRGLTVTASTLSDTNPGTGVGTQISMAAAGAFSNFNDTSGPPGLLAAAPAGHANRLDGNFTSFPPDPLPCGCRTTSEGATFAYLQGTSMAAPQVTAIAALMRRLNPDASAHDVIRALKRTARRPSGTWTNELGWGILDAGAALEAIAALDRRPPTSRARAVSSTRARRFRVSWSAGDPGPAGVRASGVSAVELWRSMDGGSFRRIGRFARLRSVLVRAFPRHRYAFQTVAVDVAGNRQALRRGADVTVRVR